MSAKVNFVLKTNDATAVQVKKALTGAGIEVRAVVEIYRESATEEPLEGTYGLPNAEAKRQGPN
ncbi:MAG: hypothetical protein JW759_07090 [Candidatus Coatesbacteria bacterium]|nr:hypothetical protein [Candidatus Coatesbacteria bacterium]